MATVESIQASLRTAGDWQKKGQPAWVSKCLSSALMGYLNIAVVEHHTPASGLAWLESQNVADVLQKQFDTLQALGAEVAAGRLPSSVIGGNYHPLVCAHLAWCLSKYELGKSLVSFADSKDVGELGTPFWREYARAMRALIQGDSYHPNQLKLKGQEKYWMTYLLLIEAACNGKGVDEAVANVEEHFTMRNGDKNIKDDAYQIEGSGGLPAKWDFRRTGLLNFISSRQR